MATQYIQKAGTTANFLARAPDRSLAAGIGSVSDVLYHNVAGVAVALVDVSTAQTLTNMTLTNPVINGAQGSFAYERLITTRLLTAADSGKIFGLALAGGFTVTLPALAAGLRFKFIIEISPTTAYIITSAEGTNISLVGAATDGAAITIADAGFAATHVNLVANAAIIGDMVDVVSVGTAGWAANATVGVHTGVTNS
jgi:hypothetical protein